MLVTRQDTLTSPPAVMLTVCLVWATLPSVGFTQAIERDREVVRGSTHPAFKSVYRRGRVSLLKSPYADR